jgi:hypothetical protein
MGTVRFIHAYHSLGAAILVRFLTCFGVCVMRRSLAGSINCAAVVQRPLRARSRGRLATL